MAKLTQKDFNEVADYHYGLQRDETTHQSNRMMWSITAQALVFAGVCSLLKEQDKIPILLPLLLIVGSFLAISAVYSSLISEISIGNVLDSWNDYHSRPIENKPHPIKHKIITVPSVILNSNLSWLAFHTFAPKVFIAAWMVFVLYYICSFNINCQPIYVLTFFIIALVLTHILLYVYKLLILLRIKNTKNDVSTHQMNSNKHCCNIFCCGSCKNHQSCYTCEPCNSCNAFAPCNPYIIPNSNRYCQNFEKLSIYHIMIDRFCGDWGGAPESINDFIGGNLKGIISKLCYIKSQGYNAIMLTPFYKSVSYHGYHITDYENVDEHFGDWEIFKMLVIQAHQLGMKVICDFVPNHCHVKHPFFQNALKKGDKRNWFYINPDNNSYTYFQEYKELPKFNLKNQDTANYLIKIAKELSLCGVDGIRIDHAVGVPFEFLKALRASVKKVNPNILVFGEVLPVKPEYIDKVECRTEERRNQMKNNKINQDELQFDYSDTLDGILDFAYRDIILCELSKGNDISTTNCELMSKLRNHFNKYSKGFMPIIFLDNHDVNRIMFYCNGNRCLMDKIVNFTRSLNIPYCIYYGTEQYMCNKHSLDCGTDHVDLEVRKPMDWN